uniref:7TM_GPCR_Srx domain-containing protein n=1 Tax=Strongyloides venezuelensis TaxID=75913 RepID=A0A0K0FJC7_STRVS
MHENFHTLHCFGYICTVQLISNTITLTIFLFWSCPSLLFLKESNTYEIFNHIFGDFGILAWNLTMYSHIACCINRFIAMFYPTKYSGIFDKRTCTIIIFSIWILSICHVVPYIFFGCTYKFSSANLTWIFEFNKCTQILTSIDLYLSLTNVCCTLFLDFLIFIKLGIQGKKATELHGTSAISVINVKNTDVQSSHRKVTVKKSSKTKSVYSNRVRFFLQSFIQNILIAIELICFHIICYRVQGKIWAMVFSSCAWALCHTLDGFVLCIFNKEIRNSLLRVCFHNK